jgi:hypothetical protein
MRWVASEPVDLGLTPEDWSLGYRNGILDLPSRWRAGRETGGLGAAPVGCRGSRPQGRGLGAPCLGRLAQATVLTLLRQAAFVAVTSCG